MRNDRFWLGYNLRLAAFSQTLPAFSFDAIMAGDLCSLGQIPQIRERQLQRFGDQPVFGPHSRVAQQAPVIAGSMTKIMEGPPQGQGSPRDLHHDR